MANAKLDARQEDVSPGRIDHEAASAAPADGVGKRAGPR